METLKQLCQKNQDFQRLILISTENKTARPLKFEENFTRRGFLRTILSITFQDFQAVNNYPAIANSTVLLIIHVKANYQ